MNIQQIADILEFELEDVQMLMNMFLADAKESLINVQSAIEANDYQQIKNSAHSIKGSASNLMLEEISLMAQQIEQLAKTNTVADYRALFSNLALQLQSIEEMEVIA